MLGTLSAVTLILQYPQRQLTYPHWRHIRPTMHQIVLPKLWHIHKSVSITVVLRLTVFEMQQSAGGKAVVEMYASVKVHLLLQVGVKICVGTKSVCSLRFQKLDRKSVVVGQECRSRWSPYH